MFRSQWWESLLIQRRQYHNTEDRQSQDLQPPFSPFKLSSRSLICLQSSSGKDGTGDLTKEGSTDRADGWLSFNRQNYNQDTSTEETTNQSLHKLTFANIQRCLKVSTVLWHNRFVLIKPTNTIPSCFKINPLSFFGCFSSVFRAGQISNNMYPFRLWFTGASQEGIVSDTRIQRQIWSNQMQPFRGYVTPLLISRYFWVLGAEAWRGFGKHKLGFTTFIH